MEYNEIRASMDSCRKNISSLKKQIRSNVEEQQSCRNSVKKIEENYQLEIREQKKAALNAYLQEKTRGLESQLEQKESVFQQLQQDYNQRESELCSKDPSSLYTGSDDITAEIRASLAILQEQLSLAISPRFQAALEQQMSTAQANIQINKVQDITKVSLDDNTTKEGKLQVGAIFLIVFLVMLITAKFMFPVYVLFLIILSAYNMHKHYCIYSALVAQKLVKDNLALIERDLRDKANAKLQAEKDELSRQYQPQLDQLNTEINALRDKISNVSLQETNNFQFDGSASREAYMNSQKVNKKHLEELIETAQSLNAQLQEKNQLYHELGQKLHNIAGDIQEKYLNYGKIGESVIFDTQFIIDIENSKPIFFTHPKDSCLFLYNKQEEIANFIKLLCVQLRIKLSPMNLQVAVVDQQSLGVQYLVMDTSDSEDEAVKQLFRIITDKLQADDTIADLNAEVDHRVGTILRNYEDIEEYNTAMVESDSLTESYNFLFYLDPTLEEVKGSAMTSLLKNAGLVGIYSHICINLQDFREISDSAAEIVKRVSTVYVLQNGSIYKKAKDFALENLVVHKK